MNLHSRVELLHYEFLIMIYIYDLSNKNKISLPYPQFCSANDSMLPPTLAMTLLYTFECSNSFILQCLFAQFRQSLHQVLPTLKWCSISMVSDHNRRGFVRNKSTSSLIDGTSVLSLAFCANYHHNNDNDMCMSYLARQAEK